MAAKLDVAGRLAEARPAVDNIQSYVWACHLLDYQNPDLTTHPAQIRDWFSSEDGMDLHVLDADCTALAAAAATADEAAGRQRDQLSGLSAAWQGSGATSSEGFIRRHCDAADRAAASVRAAADALAGLRDTLWQIVDTEAAAVIAIDDRRQQQRPAWLAAARTVSTGVGDRAAASELIDEQVKPFVDNDIRVDWLTAVRTAIASIGSSYDTAIAGLTSTSPAEFDVPGDFGPDPAPQIPRDGLAARDPASSPPAPAAPLPVAAPSYSLPSPPTAPAMAAMPAGLPSGPSVPGPMPTAPAPLTGLDGFPQRVADALNGLITPPSADDPTLEGDVGESETADTDDETRCPTGEHTEGAESEPEANTADPAPAHPVPPPPPPQAPAPPQAPPPPDAPPPPESPIDAPRTPCEIAADELPQAGQ